MSDLLPLLSEAETSRGTRDGENREEAGFGALKTEKGLLPLKAMAIRGRIDGLLAQVDVRQTFVNPMDEPLEATYIFPLPDRAGVTRFRLEVAGRVVEGRLEERGHARKEYQQAIEAGHRASIAEEERPGVFTIRVGNLPPGEAAVVELALTGPLPFAEGEITFRFPLVVAPRYIPGTPLPGTATGLGVAHDTDAVPDASRISPPVLLPGFPNPVALSFTIDVHESVAAVHTLRSSLHTVIEQAAAGYRRLSLRPDERLDRDFILRFRLSADSIETSLSVHPDSDGDASGDGSGEGTFALTIVPPLAASREARPRDLTFVLDRSGSMEGWKMVAARRALTRMVDTLSASDRFNVLAFDDRIESPPSFPASCLVAATDRQRFRAVEFLAAIEARGGTAMAQPLCRAVDLLSSAADDADRDRVLVLITDGQVGNEDQVLRELAPRLQGIRVFTLGIDQAVNEAFLHRLAELGRGSCELVESEERLDEVMNGVHRRIGTPLVTGLQLEPGQLPLVSDTLVPGRLPDLFASAPLLILGRYCGTFPEAIHISGQGVGGAPWAQTVAASIRKNPAITAAWARGQLRKLEDRYLVESRGRARLEQAIVATSKRFGVLCRFTAYVAIDEAEVVNPGGAVHQVVQPVERPAGWTSMRFLRESPTPPPAASPRRLRSPVGERLDSVLSAEPPDLEEAILESPPASAAFAAGPLSADTDDLAMEERLHLRLRTSQLLKTLERTLRSGGTDLIIVLQAIIPELETMIRELRNLESTPLGLPELEALLEKLRGIMTEAQGPAAAVEVTVLEKLATAVRALAILLGAEDKANRPGPVDPRPETFWK